jgi:hypothetical protein
VWEVVPGNRDLIRKIRLGTATLADLVAGGAIHGGWRATTTERGARTPETAA